MSVQFFGSQIGGETKKPLSYTGPPWRLFTSDLSLFIRWSHYLPNIVFPLWPWPSGDLDELYPSLANISDIILHSILFIAQAVFLISLPLLSTLSFSLFVAYVGAFIALNSAVCWPLNGKIPEGGLESTKDDQSRSWTRHDDESWIFLNGVAVGKHWLQSNIDRISRTFHRPVVGVHNQTSGIIFDVIQCLIQRAFCYNTSDIRICYVLVKKALYTPGIKKVVLILHSQGAIEGGMILDWLLNEVPHDLLKLLEVYTFGNAANHFNNPFRDHVSSVTASTGAERRETPTTSPARAIAHIEHYANSEDFVSRWGVLHFTRKMPKDRLENRFMGRVFERPGKGHQFNQHYLDNIFPLDATCRFVREPERGDFMDMEIVVGGDARSKGAREGIEESLRATTEARVLNDSPTSARTERPIWLKAKPWVHQLEMTNGDMEWVKVRNLSRLWAYRNGGSPPACHEED